MQSSTLTSLGTAAGEALKRASQDIARILEQRQAQRPAQPAAQARTDGLAMLQGAVAGVASGARAGLGRVRDMRSGMGRGVSRLRLLPIVLFAAGSLLVLKTAGLITHGSYTLRGLAEAQADDAGGGRQRSWAQEVLGYPDPRRRDTPAAEEREEEPPIVTGSVPAAAETAEPAPGVGRRTEQPPEGRVVPVDGGPHVTPGERAVLERLQERREELDRRARDLDTREGLLKAAEQRLEMRLAELRQLEAKVEAAFAQKEEAETARFKGIVTMYENMKPKDAARIFDRLELPVLLSVATQMNPRRMSDILAQMTPEVAQRLTVELAVRPRQNTTPAADQLPKIEGRPRS